MSWGPSHFGHVRGQTPDVAVRAEERFSRRLPAANRAASRARIGLVWGQAPATPRGDWHRRCLSLQPLRGER
jgi:hypothetical protein